MNKITLVLALNILTILGLGLFAYQQNKKNIAYEYFITQQCLAEKYYRSNNVGAVYRDPNSIMVVALHCKEGANIDMSNDDDSHIYPDLIALKREIQAFELSKQERLNGI